MDMGVYDDRSLWKSVTEHVTTGKLWKSWTELIRFCIRDPSDPHFFAKNKGAEV
jgi:hypothetical protein